MNKIKAYLPRNPVGNDLVIDKSADTHIQFKICCGNAGVLWLSEQLVEPEKLRSVSTMGGFFTTSSHELYRCHQGQPG